MYSLSDQQISFILHDIGARGVKTESLQQNLLDHICIIIEQELGPDGDFDSFYSSTIGRFYEHELNEIEAETQLLLTFKNYYTMKKIMMISGLVTVCAFIAGSFFKIMYWPGASILLTLGFGGVSFFFLPILCLIKMKESKSATQRAAYASGTIAAITYFLFILFKVQHWPGANVLLFATPIIGFFLALPLYYFDGIKRPETRMKTMINSVILLAALGAHFTLIALHPAPKPVNSQSTASVAVANK